MRLLIFHWAAESGQLRKNPNTSWCTLWPGLFHKPRPTVLIFDCRLRDDAATIISGACDECRKEMQKSDWFRLLSLHRIKKNTRSESFFFPEGCTCVFFSFEFQRRGGEAYTMILYFRSGVYFTNNCITIIIIIIIIINITITITITFQPKQELKSVSLLVLYTYIM